MTRVIGSETMAPRGLDEARATPGAVEREVAAPFAYGGMRVAWVEDGVACTTVRLPEEHALHAGLARPAAADVEVEVVSTRRPPPSGDARAMRWAWSGSTGRAESGWAALVVEQIAERRFRVQAHTVAGAAGRAAILSLLAPTVVERLGGLVLHATAVVLGGRAVLFIGPSGAGKTTSARHMGEATWLARDRAVVVRDELGRWQAWGAPGGDDVPLEHASDVVAPLGAVLRVLRSEGASRIVPLPPASALLRLRESIQSGATDRDGEHGALDAAARLLREVPVAAVEVALGCRLADVVAPLVSERAHDEPAPRTAATPVSP